MNNYKCYQILNPELKDKRKSLIPVTYNPIVEKHDCGFFPVRLLF